MQHAQRKTLEAARKVQKFLEAHASALGKPVPSSLRAQFNAAVGEFAAHQLEQRTAQEMGKSETASRTGYRRDVYVLLIRPIAGIANLALRSVSEFRVLIMPAAPGRCRVFVVKATILADAAEKYEDVFKRYGMPDGFVDQLRAVLTQITTSTAASAHHKHRQVW
jgi:hypothetical protein